MATANTEILKEMANGNSSAAKVAECILGAKGRFCRIVMKPQESDFEKRGGKQRVFTVNPRINYGKYAEKKFGIAVRLTERTKKALETKKANGQITIAESVHGKGGRFEFQPRTLALSKVESVSYGDNKFSF